MAKTKLLYFLGGEAALKNTAADFVAAAGGDQAHIVLLLQGGSDWREYLSTYMDPWCECGIARCSPVIPDEDGSLDLDDFLAKISCSSAIFIGGGDTRTYQMLYAQEPAAEAIRQCYRAGIPIGGVSAGALLMLEHCVPFSKGQTFTPDSILPGLGLLADTVVGVHFSESQLLPQVLEAMAWLKITSAWGIDEPAAAVFADGQFQRSCGGPVYTVHMSDFQTRVHSIQAYA